MKFNKYLLIVALAGGFLLANNSQAQIPFRIGVDPGHGGTDSGAVGPTGLAEETVNLATALALRTYLQADGATVFITRTTDTTVSLTSRTNFFMSNAVNRAVSVHHNSGGSTNKTMDFVYCARCFSTGGNLASSVIQRVGSSTGLAIGPPASTAEVLCSGRSDWSCGRDGVGQANLHMVREPELGAQIPSILVEVSFISNSSEETRLKNADYLDSNGWAIYAGVADHFGVIPKPRQGQCSSGTSTLSNRDGGPPIHPPGSVIKTASNSTVYLIDPDNRKRPITSASVLAQLYNQATDARTSTSFSNWVITVGQSELDLYEQGGNISAAQPGNGKPFPDGKLIGFNGEVSIVTGVGKRRPFVSASTLTGLGFNFCQVVNVSQTEYNSYPAGPPVDAMVLLVSSLNLNPGSPYAVGQNITGTFTVKNVGYASMPFSSLGIGGRLNGSTVFDMNFISTTLAAGSSHPFGSQARQLTSTGTYDFFVAYQESNGHWAISVPAAPGVIRSRQITVSSCNYSLSPTSQSFGSGGGSNNVSVTAGAGCAWTAVSNSSFITITSGSSGSGNGTVSYSVSSNSSTSQRTGTMTIAGQTFNVTQSGSSCNYSIFPTSQSFGSVGGSNNVSVTAGSGCAWTAVSNSSFITINSGSSGSGNGTVSYSVSSNSSTSQRTGTMTIAGQTFNVTQSGASCSYSISPTSQSFGSGGGSNNVSVTAGSGCAWTAVSNSSFITINSGSTGSGNGTVSYSVSSNSSTSQRTGTMTIAGQTFNVTQSGISCSYSLFPTSQSFGSVGESNNVSVTAGSGCAWTAVSNSSFITINSGSSGSGNGNVNYSVSSNSSTSQRTGTMTIAGQTFNVTQSGISCSYSLFPTSQSFGSVGESNNVSVTAGSGCAWTAVSNSSFITINSGSTGSGNGNVNYSVSSNSSTSQRTGTMTIAGQTFTVNQDAPNGGMAAYDLVLKAPKCGQPGSACDSGTLLNGRDNMAGGPETNQPNTINNSCADGTFGNYHVDESIEAIKVSTLDGGNLASGKTVKVDVTVWVYQDFANDHLDLYYSLDATSPNWVFITTLTPTVAGSQVLTATYTLPSGGSLQAVRGNFRYAGTPSSCSTDSGFDDHDDLIFSTSGTVTSTNFALAANGGVATASSQLDAGRAASAANNGDRRGIHWGTDPATGSGWHSASTGQSWLQVDFNGSKSIDEIDVFSPQDNYTNPVDPTLELTFNLYGATAFDAQYWNGSAWVTVPAGSVTGNNKVWRQFTFTAVTTSKIRVLVNGSPGGYARLTEVEAWGTNDPSSLVNVALASRGSVASASSQWDAARGALATNNGDRKGLHWASDPATGSGWLDATGNSFPDWLQIDFNGSQTISEIDFFCVQDNYANPVDPTDAMTFSLYGITNFEVQHWNGSAWVTVTGGSVTGNNLVKRRFTFSPITTSRIRVLVSGAPDGYSRLTELEAWGTDTPPPTTVNVALASQGGVASASSQWDAARGALATNNGDRKGLHWASDPATGSGWLDATGNSYPDWLQIDFSGAKTINEIDLFCVQDNYANPVDPNDGMTFSLYGITTFEVQYWNGASWITVPGGSVSGNTLVKRKFTFAPITTSKIRVLVNNSPDGYSRLTELEAWSSSTTSSPNLALVANGAVATASSQVDAARGATAANNGDRRGLHWGSDPVTGSGWHSATTAQSWLQIDFNSNKNLDEIDVFTVQDNYANPVDPTLTQTFTLYGVTGFDVQYWNGSAWVTVPGGSVTANNKVWRKFNFSAITTSKIRVLTNAAPDGYGRITEIEAYLITGGP